MTRLEIVIEFNNEQEAKAASKLFQRIYNLVIRRADCIFGQYFLIPNYIGKR